MDAADRPSDAPEIPGFTILRELGQGGSSRVWLAQADDPELPRRVALKHLHAHTADDAAHLARLQREHELGQRLAHEHILPVLDIASASGRPVLVLPFVDGHALDRWQPTADDGQALSGEALLTARLAALAQVARALHHAHGAGVVHRDVKPSNILVQADGHPWLIDFGLATDPMADHTVTATVAVMGTLPYMTPEVAAGHAREASASTDVYALGAVAYTLAAGRPPFTGATREQLWQRILRDEPPRLAGRVADLPAGLEALVLRALDKDPGQRPPSALLFAEELERVLAGAASRGAAAGPLARRGLRRLLARRVRWLALAAAALAVAVVLLSQRAEQQRLELALRELLVRGDDSLDNGDLMGALAQYELAARDHASDPRPLLRQANAYAGFELAANASRAMDDAMARGWDPGRAPPTTDAPDARTPEQRYFSGLHAMVSDIERAIADIRSALDEDATWEEGHAVLHGLLMSQGREAEAHAVFDAWSADVKPRDPRSAKIQALMLEDEGRIQEAVDLLLAVQDGAEDSVAPTFWRHRNLGHMLLRLAMAAEGSARQVEHAQLLTAAEEQLNLAVGVVPLDATSLCNLGLVAWQRGDLKRADELACEALIPASGLGPAVVLRVQCALDRGDLGGALELATNHEVRGMDAARLDRMAADALVRMAAASEDPVAIVDLLARAVARHPERFDAWTELAMRRWAAAEFGAAAEAFTRAHDLWLARQSAPEPQGAIEPWESFYRQPINLTNVLVGLIDTRARSGDGPGAARALDELDQHLAGAPPADPGIAFNLAEALGTCPVPELRDLPRAVRLLDLPAVRQLVAVDSYAAGVDALIRTASAASSPTN